MKKSILIHSLIFSPDGVSTAYLYSDIALKLHQEGYDVKVLTTTPHYNILEENLAQQPMQWKLWGVCKTSNFHGITVYHIPQRKFKNTILRLLGFVYWHIMAFFMGLCLKNIDIILSPSPPLTIGVLNIWLAKIKKCKVVYNVQEIYPDILHLKEGFTLSCLKKMEKYVYNKSDAITTIDQVFYDSIVNRIIEPRKLKIIPNFVDTELYNPQNNDLSVLDQSLFFPTDALKVLYAGNIGFAQDWETLIELAKRTKDKAIEYFVIGEGVMKQYLMDKKVEYNLEHIHILPYQSRTLMPNILAYSDIQFIFMSPEMDMQGFPSKVYTIMACEKPLIVCSGEKTPIVKFLSQYDCALLVSEKELNKKIDCIYDWITTVSRADLQRLGANGLSAIKANYSTEVVTQQYVELLASL